MKYAPLATLTFISIFLAAGEMYAQSNTALDDTEDVTVYPSIEVVVNKAIVVRLPRKATKVAVTQPQIAEVVVVAPDPRVGWNLFFLLKNCYMRRAACGLPKAA
jgi:Flp pilus assembly secretin CpaC